MLKHRPERCAWARSLSQLDPLWAIEFATICNSFQIFFVSADMLEPFILQHVWRFWSDVQRSGAQADCLTLSAEAFLTFTELYCTQCLWCGKAPVVQIGHPSPLPLIQLGSDWIPQLPFVSVSLGLLAHQHLLWMAFESSKQKATVINKKSQEYTKWYELLQDHASTVQVPHILCNSVTHVILENWGMLRLLRMTCWILLSRVPRLPAARRIGAQAALKASVSKRYCQNVLMFETYWDVLIRKMYVKCCASAVHDGVHDSDCEWWRSFCRPTMCSAHCKRSILQLEKATWAIPLSDFNTKRIQETAKRYHILDHFGVGHVQHVSKETKNSVSCTTNGPNWYGGYHFLTFLWHLFDIFCRCGDDHSGGGGSPVGSVSL